MRLFWISALASSASPEPRMENGEKVTLTVPATPGTTLIAPFTPLITMFVPAE